MNAPGILSSLCSETPTQPPPVHSTTLSAGFIFFSQPPNSDDWYFLLGLDDYTGKWSDFGGRRNSEETEVHCAVREMLEETMGVVQLLPQNDSNDIKNNVGLNDSISYICNMLEKKDFTFRIQVDVTSKGNSRDRICSQNPSSLLSVHQISPHSALSQQHQNHGTKLPKEKRLRVCYVKFIPWQPDLADVFATTYKSLRFINTLKDVDSKIKYIQTLPETLQSHPAIVYEYGNYQNRDRPSGIHVPNEWLEKRQIAWWSLPRLQLVVKNAGKLGGHVFRCGFLSTLAIVAQHFMHASRVKKQHDDEMRRKKNPFIYEIEDQSVLIEVLNRALDLDANYRHSVLPEFKIVF